MTATTAPAPSLTEHDRAVIAQARELAALSDTAAVREHAGEADTTAALALTWGEARFLLGELAALAERLGGGGA